MEVNQAMYAAKPVAKQENAAASSKSDFARLLKSRDESAGEAPGSTEPDKLDESIGQDKDPITGNESPDGKEDDLQEADSIQQLIQGAMFQIQSAAQLFAGNQNMNQMTDSVQVSAQEPVSGPVEAVQVPLDYEQAGAEGEAGTEGQVTVPDAGSHLDVPPPVIAAAVQQPETAEKPAFDQALSAETSQQPVSAGEQPEQVDEGSDHPDNQMSHHEEPQPGTAGRNQEVPVPAERIQIMNTGHQQPAGAAAVKTQTAAVPLKTTADALPLDVAKTIAASMPQQNGSMTIELEPASLGKLTIKVVYEDGKAAVSMMSSNPRTLELLSQRAGDIAGILEEKTGQETVVIYTEQPDQQEAWQEERGGERHQQDDREEPRKSHPDTFAQQLRLGLV